ncbi:MAG: helix-turn-helix domain-containing protein [Flavobacteriales bacterium]|jgi:excisionase family DNA binding protein|nr:helix-turn-helix domain-containing protein [Flavobacteriales bacterium]
MDEELITTKELCEWLKISKATASNWRKQGMPYYGKARSLRYKKSEVNKWLDKEENK